MSITPFRELDTYVSFFQTDYHHYQAMYYMLLFLHLDTNTQNRQYLNINSKAILAKINTAHTPIFIRSDSTVQTTVLECFFNNIHQEKTYIDIAINKISIPIKLSLEDPLLLDPTNASKQSATQNTRYLINVITSSFSNL